MEANANQTFMEGYNAASKNVLFKMQGNLRSSISSLSKMKKGDNPMDLMDLERRMKEFLETEYNAYFFIENSQIIGYAQAFHMLLEYLGIKRNRVRCIAVEQKRIGFLGNSAVSVRLVLQMKYKEQRGINCTK